MSFVVSKKGEKEWQKETKEKQIADNEKEADEKNKKAKYPHYEHGKQIFKEAFATKEDSDRYKATRNLSREEFNHVTQYLSIEGYTVGMAFDSERELWRKRGEKSVEVWKPRKWQ